MAEYQHTAHAEPSTTAAESNEATSAPTHGDSAMGEAPNDNTTAAPPPPVPGVRAERLQSIYADALGGTLRKLSWANFAGCYPTVAKRADRVLRKLQEQMTQQLQDLCEKKFDEIVKSRQVVAKLNELEALVGEAERAREEAGDREEPTPPHTLPPPAILAAHLHPALAQHQSQLRDRLQQTQVQNALLVDEVRRQRAEMDELLTRLEDAAADVRGANEVLAAVVGELAEETRLDAEHV